MAGDFSGFTNLIYDPATQTTQQTGTYLYQARQPRPHAPASFVLRLRMNITMAIGFRAPASIQSRPPLRRIGLSPTHRVFSIRSGLVTNNYTYTAPQSSPFIRYFGRLDYQIKPNNRLMISESEGDNPGEGFGAGICPIDCQSQDVSKQNAQISDVWSISSRVTNEVRMGYTNQLNFFSPFTAGLGYPGKIGLKFAKADTFPTFNINTYAGHSTCASIQRGL